MSLPETEPVVTLEEVSTRLVPGREDHAPLARVSLRVQPGQIYALLGAKGAGKSDLLRLLAGRLMPVAGLIRYGLSLGQSNEARAHNIGYCAQRPELAPDLSVHDHLSLFAAIAKLPEADRAPRIERVARQLGLVESLDDLVESETAGVQQRLHVALSMLHSPLLWLLDEPFVGLDEAAQETLWRALAEHRSQGGAAVVVCSDFKHVEESADWVWMVSRGRLLHEARPHDLVRDHGSIARALVAITGDGSLD
ncbi:MAG: ABC transporter ATP-binding protein [Myxococcales bacterium]